MHFIKLVLTEFIEVYASSTPAMSNPQAACGPEKGFVQPSLGFRYNKSFLHTNNLSLFW